MEPEAFVVDCHACGHSFDALSVPWCACLATERSLVCPGCLSCFCRAPAEYRRRFWSGAPPSLWQSKSLEHFDGGWMRPNPEPSEVARPLVLIVDDELTIVRLAARAVEGLQCGVIHASDGIEGLELARRYLPDLVLTDALMPGMDGREMGRMLKENPETRSIKVVVMTAVYVHTRDLNEGRRLYLADDYVTKPFSFRELQRTIQKLLGDATPFEARVFPRQEVRVAVRLRRLAPREGQPADETTETENLGTGGALVRTRLAVDKGEMLLFEEANGPFRTRALVQEVRIGSEGGVHLHLAFVDAQLPHRILEVAAGTASS